MQITITLSAAIFARHMPYDFHERYWALDHTTVFGVAPITIRSKWVSGTYSERVIKFVLEKFSFLSDEITLEKILRKLGVR